MRMRRSWSRVALLTVTIRTKKAITLSIAQLVPVYRGGLPAPIVVCRDLTSTSGKGEHSRDDEFQPRVEQRRIVSPAGENETMSIPLG